MNVVDQKNRFRSIAGVLTVPEYASKKENNRSIENLTTKSASSGLWVNGLFYYYY